jgi:hypothetical protein
MSSVFHGSAGVYGSHVSSNFYHSPRRPAPGVSGNRPKLSDEQILELRALSEFAGWDRVRLATRFAVDIETVKRILEGVTRSRLIATRKHLPAGMETV